MPQTEFDSHALKQSVTNFLNSVELSSVLGQEFLANPVAVLRAQNVPLPTVEANLEAAFAETYVNLLTVPGTHQKRSFDWYGSPDSVACWACSITLNTAIWAAITAGVIAAVIATDGAIIGPAVASASGLTATQAAGLVATASATMATGSLAGAAAAGSLPAALATFINYLVTLACNAIPNCCSTKPAVDNGIWNADDDIGNDQTMAKPAFAATGDGTTVAFCNQDSNTSNPYLWRKVATYKNNNWSWGTSEPITVSNAIVKTLTGPALVGTNTAFYLTWVDGDVKSSTYKQLMFMPSPDKGVTWNEKHVIISTSVTTMTPAIAYFGGALIVAYVALDGSLQMIRGTINGVPGSGGSVTWSSSQPIGSGTPVAPYHSGVEPTLGVFDGKLICAYKRATDNGLRTTSSTDGHIWSQESWLPDHILGRGPALGSLGNLLVCLYTGPSDTNLRYSTSSDGLNWTIEYRCDGNLTSASPTLASTGSKLYALYKGGANNKIYWTSLKS